jgi:hypothetical protein
MLPIGPLMWEHRLIERMIKLMDAEEVAIEKTEKLDPNLIAMAIDSQNLRRPLPPWKRRGHSIQRTCTQKPFRK